MLRTVANVLWLVLSGLWLAIGYWVAGLLLCLTIVGIPFGIQAIKIGNYALWPFGRVVVDRAERRSGFFTTIGNVLWLIIGGIWIAAAHLALGITLCLTIIGIPFGIANFKMIRLALWPFGSEIIGRDELEARSEDVKVRIKR
jgi:uncharacterized membrane protein YccF (DUF307 family)